MAGTCATSPDSGDTLFDREEHIASEESQVAVTVKLYSVPFVSPVIVHGELLQTPVSPPGTLVAV